MSKVKRARHYLDKQPERGDRIVIVDAYLFSDMTNGQELIITDIATFHGTHVYAYSPRHGKVVLVADTEYRIYSDTVYELTGTDIIEKKFLGITYRRREIEKWRKCE
ncbi:hypothetical protein [Sporosarcina koreensis]|uniref:hypothetical protein n=1 Tax=Sporosarcina koreensis TaxID=334735 RepID=UPI0007540DC6|nr:hypothetical protein [Sporosarcina koreensis]